MVPISTMMGEEERPKSAGKGMGLKGVGNVSRLVWLGFWVLEGLVGFGWLAVLGFWSGGGGLWRWG